MTTQTETSKSVHVHTIRSESVKAVSASIFRNRQGKLYIAPPSRAYKTPEQKEDPKRENEFSYTSSMYPDQIDACCEVMQGAKSWIEQQNQS